MPLTTKTFDELAAIARGVIRGHIDGADVSDLSDYDISARMVAAVSEGQQAQAEYLAKQIFPETADDEHLLLHAKRCGLARMPAAKASGKLLITADSGTPTQASGSTLTHADGTQYVLTSSAPVTLPGWSSKLVGVGSTRQRLYLSNVTGILADHIIAHNGGVGVVKDVLTPLSAIDLYHPLGVDPSPGDSVTAVRGCVATVAAVDFGTIGNKPPGDDIDIDSPVAPSIEALVVELSGGGDEESIEDLRARVIAYDTYLPAAGNPEFVRTTARQTPGVRIADVVVFPSYFGLGTIYAQVIGLPGARVVSDSTAQAVQSHLESILPAGVDVACEPLRLDETERNVTLTVRAELGYERDYAGSAVEIASGSSTTVVNTTTAISAQGAEIGDRVQIQLKVAGSWRIYQRAIAAMTATSITLSEPLPIAPTTSDPDILPGGPLVEAIEAKVIELFESLGPSRHSDTFLFERHPDPTTVWDDTLRKASITEAVMGIDGVNNVAISTPVSDVLVPDTFTVRRGLINIYFEEVT